MARIEGEITIGRPVEVVFDYVADQTNEPQYNPKMVRAEKVTAGPIGKGTRFRSAVRSAGRTAEMLIEFTGYDRPRLLASTTTMKQMDIEYTLDVRARRGGHSHAVVRRGTAQGWTTTAGAAGHLDGRAPGTADLVEPEESPGERASRRWLVGDGAGSLSGGLAVLR